MVADTVGITLLMVAVLACAVFDYKQQRIPNAIVYPVIIIAAFYHGMGYGMAGLIFSIRGLMVGIGLLIVPYLLGGMGAGDAKLLGAIGAALGAKSAFVVFLYTALLGGVYALILILVHQEARIVFENFLNSFKNIVLTRQYAPILSPGGEGGKSPRLCYGIAIAGGTVLHVVTTMTGYPLF